VQLPEGKNAQEVVQQLADDYGIIAGYPADDKTILITATEITTDGGINALTEALQEVL
jgi:hypothetical protein